MKIKMRYEDAYQTIEVETKEIEKWLNISISEEESEDDYEKRIQEEIEVQFNRPDYNSWHKHDRHTGVAKCKGKDGTVEVNTDEAIIAKAVDTSVFTKSIDDVDTKLDLDYQYKHYCKQIREVLKPTVADMVIAIVLDGLSVGEYADSIGEDSNNVSHRYRRAINKLKKFFQKHPFNPVTKATQ